MKPSAISPDPDPETPDGPEPHAPPVLGCSWLQPAASGLGGIDLGLEIWRQAMQSGLAFWSAVGVLPKTPDSHSH
jgi:hypothetical protein